MRPTDELHRASDGAPGSPLFDHADPARAESVGEGDRAASLTHLMAPREGHAPVGPARRRGAALRPPEESRPGLRRMAASLAAKSSLMLILVWAMFFNFSEVRGNSMLPGIHDRDRILVDHMTYLFAPVEREDVVVLRYPLDPSLDYVKRIVGLPGDHVEIYRGKVWVNGGLLAEPYLDDEFLDPYAVVDTVVDEQCYFVLGDNRIRSSDSREFGQVPFEYLRGKVRLRLWPLGRVGLVD